MWASSDTFDIDGRPIRLRTNRADVGATLRILLADRLVADRPAPYSFSLRLEAPVDRAQPLHVLYEDCALVRRTRDPVRIVRLLLACLRHDDPADDGTLHLAGCAAVGDRGAVLFPPWLTADAARLERRLAARGLALVDTPILAVDAASGELVVPPPPALDESVLASLDVDRADGPTPARPGRHRIVAWLLDDAQAYHEAASLVVAGPATPGARWRAIDALLRRVTVIESWRAWPDEVLATMVRLTGAV